MKRELKVKPFDKSNLFRIQEISDNAAGTVIEYIPITAEGADDLMRKRIYQIRTFLNGNAIQLEIPNAETALEAMDLFPTVLQQTVDEAESQRERARIANPDGLNGQPLSRIIQDSLRRKN